MYAVVNTGGKQAKVVKDAVIAVEKLDTEVGGTVTLPVVFLADGDRVLATPTELAGVVVSVEVLEHFKGEKQMVFKLKKRKGYKRTRGHRQELTAVRVVDIVLGEAPAKAAKPSKTGKAGTPARGEKVAASAKAGEPVGHESVPGTGAPADAAAESAVCQAAKADGSPCTNKAKEGSKYCGVHAKKLGG